ncbi:NAD(P)H-binding protein [Amycolatopsis regifaucium]|nr:NAD(P)H-binding protein [Amycolatopsis regifaucium]
MLITGANGVVGRQVLNLLLREGTLVAAVTRGPGGPPLPGGAKVVSGDLFRPQWIKAALDGVEAIQLSPRATGPGLDELLKPAAGQGVQRVVLLSATTVEHPAGKPASRPTRSRGRRSSRRAMWCAAPTAGPPPRRSTKPTSPLSPYKPFAAASPQSRHTR